MTTDDEKTREEPKDGVTEVRRRRAALVGILALLDFPSVVLG